MAAGLSLGEALGFVGSILAFLLAIIFGLIRYADSQKRAEYEKTFTALQAESKRLEEEHRRALERLQDKNAEQDRENKRVVEKMHQLEISILQQQSKIDLSNASRDNILRDMDEIKSEMVTKTEFQALQKALDSILRELRPGSYRRTQTPSPAGG